MFLECDLALARNCVSYTAKATGIEGAIWAFRFDEKEIPSKKDKVLLGLMGLANEFTFPALGRIVRDFIDAELIRKHGKPLPRDLHYTSHPNIFTGIGIPLEGFNGLMTLAPVFVATFFTQDLTQLAEILIGSKIAINFWAERTVDRIKQNPELIV